jgi:2-haloacid dehalogenase
MLDSLGCNPKTAARVVEPALRPDVGRRPRHRQQGVRQPRPRPRQPGYRYTEIRDIGGLPGVVGL